ncbi:MAG: SelB C-terminal domain-containing protein, partial [Burkholderiaceae bacterium]
VGIDRDDVERGAWLTAPDIALVTDPIDVDLTVWSAESRPLRSGTPVHVHLGAAAATGTVAILAPDEIAPGASGRAQLVLRAPIGAWHGDRVVLRDASASRTLAGGSVLDPFAPTRYRRTALRLAELDALVRTDPIERLVGLVAQAPQGVDLVRYRCAQGRDAPVVLPEGALRATEASSDWVIGVSQVDDARRRVLEALAAFHAAHAEELGPGAARLRRLAVPRLADTPWRALLAAMRSAGEVAVQGAFVHRPEHGVRLSAAEQRMAERIVPRMARDGFEGSWVRDLARDGGEPEIHVRVTLARLARRGELHQVVKDLYYPPPAMARLAAIARDTGRSGEVTAAAFRDATGLGRKRAIQILEYLDRIGVLRRVGDVHKVRTDATVFTEAQR